MQKARSRQQREACTAEGAVQVLVISQHEAVRRQLVAYLGRSSSLLVSGDELSADAITRTRPAVLVLDLSRLGDDGLHLALGVAQNVGARVIALASIRETAEERAVVEAGGLYRLKSAGADGLADTVRDAARWERGHSFAPLRTGSDRPGSATPPWPPPEDKRPRPQCALSTAPDSV